jgi:hypothetical protein
MGCQRYQSWITDEALGALAENRERELLSHASECAACSAALDRSRVLHQAIALGMAETVSAEPSPELTARVRQRISQTTEPAHSRLAALFPVVAGALALAALLAFWLRPQQAPPRPPGAATQSREIATTGQTPSQPTATIKRSPAELSRHSRGELTATNLSLGRPEKTAPAIEVLVPPGEWQAVVKFAATLNSAGLVRTQFRANIEEVRNPLEVKPLDFPSLEVTRLEEGQPASETGSR